MTALRSFGHWESAMKLSSPIRRARSEVAVNEPPLRHSFTAPVNVVVVRRRLVNETCAATRCSGLKPSGRLCAAKKLRTKQRKYQALQQGVDINSA
jgi:hypothetical protein